MNIVAYMLAFSASRKLCCEGYDAKTGFEQRAFGSRGDLYLGPLTGARSYIKGQHLF